MTRQTFSPQVPAFFVSADWSKDTRKRSVHVADLSARRIRRPKSSGWTLEALLSLGANLARRGPVLVGIDAALGVPAGYWDEVQTRDWGVQRRPANFIDWLSRLDSAHEFFEPVDDSSRWRVDRPFFRVAKGKGGRTRFTARYEDRFLRRIDHEAGAKPLFAVSGMPGTVGWGTISLWTELIPLLADTPDFAVWPFEGDLPHLLARGGVVLAEAYPGLAYAAAMADDLPTGRLTVAKTNPERRKRACELLQATAWVRHFGVDLGDLEPVRNNDDAFDSHLTAAAVLRCGLEGRALCDREWIDNRAGGAMLLAGPVDPRLQARSLAAQQPTFVRLSNKPATHPALAVKKVKPSAYRVASVRRSSVQPKSTAPAGIHEYRCPIPGCSKVFMNTRGGWDAHVASRRMHPDWRPDLTNPEDRKRRFKVKYRDWFQ